MTGFTAKTMNELQALAGELDADAQSQSGPNEPRTEMSLDDLKDLVREFVQTLLDADGPELEVAAPAPAEPPATLDTTNYFLVGVQGDDVTVFAMRGASMTKARALNLAAWLVALADDNDEFPALLAAVRNT